MKNKIRVNKKYLDSLGLNIDADELPKDAIIKRINFNDDNKGLFSSSSDLEQVKPHSLVQEEEGKLEEGQYSIGTITTIDVDSDGDVVLPRGIDISRYEKNPVVLFQHNLDMPIGYAEELTVYDDRITAKTRFANTDEARKVHQLLKDNVLRTHSIGFVTLEFELKGTRAFDSIMKELKSKFPYKFTDEMSKRVDRIVTKSMLLEYSIVTIPANEEAVINEIKICKEQQELIEETSESSVKSEIKQENPQVKIKIVKRAKSINKLSTLKEREQERLKEAFLKLWGV